MGGALLRVQRGKLVKTELEEAETIITPDSVLAEVAKKYLRKGVEERKDSAEIVNDSGGLEPAYIDEVALEAGNACLQLEARAKRLGQTQPVRWPCSGYRKDGRGQSSHM